MAYDFGNMAHIQVTEPEARLKVIHGILLQDQFTQIIVLNTT